MAELPLDQAIPRFKTNEDRIDTFVNGDENATYTTSGGVQVPSVRKVIADINEEGEGWLAQAEAAAATIPLNRPNFAGVAAVTTAQVPVGGLVVKSDDGSVYERVASGGLAGLAAPMIPRVGADGTITARQLGIPRNSTSPVGHIIQAAMDDYALPASAVNILVPTNNTRRALKIELGDGYYPASGLNLQAGITLGGSGMGSTILMHDDENRASINIRSDAGWWGIEDMTIHGGGSVGPGADFTYEAAKSGININSNGGQNSAYGAYIRNVHLQRQKGHGITHDKGGVASEIIFDNVRITRTNGLGMNFLFLNDCKFSNIEIRQCRQGAAHIICKNHTWTNLKYWQARLADVENITFTRLIPVTASQSGDLPAMIVAGSNLVFNGMEVQENCCVGIQVGTLEWTMSGLEINGLLLDGNGGYDGTASPETNLLYQRDGIVLVNHHNTRIQGIADDFRQRQGFGRQRQAVVQQVVPPLLYTSGELRSDGWYRIVNNSGGANFTNLQLGLPTPSNAVGTIFQAQAPYAGGNPVPANWGTGALAPANDGLNLDLRVQNQMNQVRGISPGWQLNMDGLAPSGHRWIINGEDVSPMNVTEITVAGITTAGTATYGERTMRWQLIGRRVHFELVASWSGHTGTGFIQITGLPRTARFPQSGVTVPMGLAQIYSFSGLAFTGPVLFANAEGNVLRIRQVATNGAGTPVPITASGNIFISGSYEIA